MQLEDKSKSSFLPFFNNQVDMFSDSLLDGEEIKNKPTVQSWIDENKVHQAIFLSHDINSTRMFLGKQIISVRDEKRRLTHICFIESKSLILCTIKDGEIIFKETIYNGFTQRACLAFDKFSGKTYVLHSSSKDGENKIFLNGKELISKATNVDFPFIQLEQVPIGHFGSAEYSYGLISYKDRNTGKVYVREIVADEVKEERVLELPKILGGLDFAIYKDKVMFRVEAITENGLVHQTSISENQGKDISTFKEIDFTSLSPDSFIPTNAPIFSDYLGNFQIPVTVFKDGYTSLLNVTPTEQIVEAIRVQGHSKYGSVEKFPTKPKPGVDAFGIGNGKTDGLGVIATIQSNGMLFSSNSQSGGHQFPKETMLNFEMPKTFCFKVTNCYTKGEKPNTVSMDYLFIEADEIGDAITKRLMIETWHMPLPTPVLKAKKNEKGFHLEIIENGWFEIGKTTIWINNPTINIIDIKQIDERNLEILTDDANLENVKVSFEMKSLLYYHSGSAIIE